MNNPLRYSDPTGFLTQAEYDLIICELWNSNHGGYWTPGMSSPHFFTDGDDAMNYANANADRFRTVSGGLSSRDKWRTSKFPEKN